MKKLIFVLMLVANCGRAGTGDVVTGATCNDIEINCDSKQDVSEGLRKTLAWAEFKLGIKVGYDVIFADLDEGIAGVCYREGIKPLGIAIDKLAWANSDTDGRRQLLLHEIGHCSYGLGHTDTVGTVMYYSMVLKGAKNRYKQAQKMFIELYNTYGGVIPHN